VLENWDFEGDGKITQEKVAKYANRDVSTLKKHWSDFKAYVKDLNISYYKPMQIRDAIPSFRLDDQVNLYDLLPELSFSIQESMAIIDGLDRSRVSMKELVT